MKIAQFEVDHQTPRQTVAESIAKTLDVPLQDLIVTVDIGDRIRKVREAQGITSHELAEMAGLKIRISLIAKRIKQIFYAI